MEYQIQYQTLVQYREIIYCDNLPYGRVKDLISDTKEGFKHAKTVWQRNLIEKMININYSTKDVQKIAMRTISNTNTTICVLLVNIMNIFFHFQ